MMMMMMMMMMSTLYSNRECAFVHVRVVDQSISMLILTLWHLVCSLLLVNFPLWNQLEAGPPGIPGREWEFPVGNSRESATPTIPGGNSRELLNSWRKFAGISKVYNSGFFCSEL